MQLKNILISDAVDQICIDILQSNGFNVVHNAKITPQELINEIPKYDGLIVRSACKVTADVIYAGKNLKVIGRAGVGVDNIDLQAASRQGVLVINAPAGNTLSAAELTCGMIMSLARFIPQACMSMKNGKWDKKSFMGQELQGKTLGVVGLGRIGREVAHRMQSFGMETIGFDPLVPAAESAKFGVEGLTLEQLYPRADYITIHTPLIPQTKNLFNDETFKKCKKGLRLVNCARGGIVDEEALLRALESGQVAGAAMDVFVDEPTKNQTLVDHPKFIGTPHLGASTKDGQLKVAQEIAEEFVLLAKGQSVPGVVNAPAFSQLLVADNKPYIALGEVLGKLAGGFVSGSGLSGLKLQVNTYGNELANPSRLLGTAVLVGILQNQGKPANFINAVALAGDSGVIVTTSHKGASDCCSRSSFVTVEVQSGNAHHTICGHTSGELPMICALDGKSFNPSVPVAGNMALTVIPKDAMQNVLVSLANSTANSIAFSEPFDNSRWCAISFASAPPKDLVSKGFWVVASV